MVRLGAFKRLEDGDKQIHQDHHDYHDVKSLALPVAVISYLYNIKPELFTEQYLN